MSMEYNNDNNDFLMIYIFIFLFIINILKSNMK